MSNYTFTSESVTEGHPDKMADQVSDAVLDAILTEDPNGRVACETLLTTGLVVVAGEVRYADATLRRRLGKDGIQVGHDNLQQGRAPVRAPSGLVCTCRAPGSCGLRSPR